MHTYQPSFGAAHETINPVVETMCKTFIALDSVFLRAYSAAAVLFAAWGLVELKGLLVKAWVTQGAGGVTRSEAEEEGDFLERAEEASSRRELMKMVLPISTLLSWLIFAAATTLSLHLLGVNVVPLLTVGSAGTLIIGLASQQLLSNTVTGVSIFFSNIFSPGESVTMILAGKSEVSGTVLKVTPMRTLLRDTDGVVISVPNKSVSDMVVVNKSRVVNAMPAQLGSILRQPLRLRLRLGGAEPVANLGALRSEAAARLAASERGGGLDAGSGRVALARLTESGVELLVTGTMLTPGFGSHKASQDLLLDLYAIAARHGAACSTVGRNEGRETAAAAIWTVEDRMGGAGGSDNMTTVTPVPRVPPAVQEERQWQRRRRGGACASSKGGNSTSKMPPTTRGQRRAQEGQEAAAALDGVTHPALLARIFERLPPVEQRVTVGRLSRAWRAWAAPRAAALRREGRQEVRSNAAYRLPLWFVQEAWPSESTWRRTRMLERAAWHDDTATLAWARSEGGDAKCWARHVCSGAAEGGSFAALQWLRRQEPPCPWDEWTSRAAAVNGHLHVLQWLWEHEPPCRWNDGACQEAARGGHLHVLQWLRRQEPPCPWSARACSAAAVNGHLHVLQWLRGQEPPCPCDGEACRAAAAGGHLHVLQWLRQQEPPCPWNGWVCRAAAAGGHLHVLQWLRGQEPPCPWTEWACEAAAAGGHLHVLQWLRGQEPPCPWDGGACLAAADGGHLHVLHWLRGQEPPCPWTEWVCEAAARGGHLHVLQWLRWQEPPCPWSQGAIDPTERDQDQYLKRSCTTIRCHEERQWQRRRRGGACASSKGGNSTSKMPPTTRGQRRAQEGQEAAAALDGVKHPALLALIFERLPPVEQRVTVGRLSRAWRAWAAPRAAALRREGRQEVRSNAAYRLPLWFVQEAWDSQPRPARTRVLARAAWHGDVTALAWARSEGSDVDCWRADVCFGAAEGGSIEALRWLRRQEPPCPWGDEVGEVAAQCGHLHVLQWLRQQEPPCPLELWTLVAAAEGGHLHVLQWLRQQAPGCCWDGWVLQGAARHGHLHVLQWMRRRSPSCHWSAGVSMAAAEGGHLHVLQWLREQEPPCPWGEGTCKAAAERSHLHVLQWLREQEPPCPWNEWACKEAARGGHLHVLQWLRRQEPPCPWNRQRCMGVAKQYSHSEVATWIAQAE
ncbi:MAG: hypothetical protein J3K34DRAFT_458686 [Monoraphidium minutum]|nr:MAG: hypothetical protein J3K34DRAFT_458686 [Monoraphidium minutum]